ncbi:hypothetical protein [Micromonospora sp. NBC_00421]
MGATWDEAHDAAKEDGEKFAVFLERAIRRELDRRARNKARTQNTQPDPE